MELKVGDRIIAKKLEGRGWNRFEGIIQHIGKLHNVGEDDSIWSTWNRSFNGIILEAGAGGELTYINRRHYNITIPKRAKEKEFNIVKFCKKYYLSK
jgi:hypothetical protein